MLFRSKYLAKSFDLHTEIAKKVIRGGKAGLMPTTTNQKHYMGLLEEEANREIIDLDEEGNEVFSYGVTKEHDIMLLEEYANYRRKVTGRGIHDGNFDRIIARGCAETLARYYDVKYPIASQIPNKSKQEVKTQSQFFQTPWGKIEKKPFQLNLEQDKKPQKPTNIPSWMQKL